MGRLIQDESWISAYLKYTQFQESPEIFHLWNGIHVIASTLKRNVFLDRGYYTIYPNLYIALVAPSAVISKTTAANIAIKLWLDAISDTILMREKLTPWAVYDYLEAATQQNGEGCLNIYAPEMRTFLNASYREEVVTMLTSLYDCPNDAPDITRTHKTKIIKNVCLNVMACSTPEWLMTGLTGSDIGGGFTGRWIYIYEDTSSRSSPFPEDNMTPEMDELRTKLAIDLNEISNLSGHFVFTDDAKKFYVNWYEKRKKEWTDERLFGYYGRKRDTVLKLAMILAVTEPKFKEVNMFKLTKQCLKLAFKLLEQAEKKMCQAFSGVTFTESVKFNDRILKQLKEKGEVKFSDLLRKNQHYVDAAMLEQTLESLLKMDSIECTRIDKRGKKYYKAL